MYYDDDYPEAAARVAVSDSDARLTNIVLVPDFIMRALTLHKANVIDIQNFGRMTNVCSLDDLALWTALTHLPYKKTDLMFSETPYAVFQETVKWPEFGTIDSLSHSEETKNAAIAYAFAEDTEEQLKFELKSIGSTILVVVRPGFLAQLEKSEAAALGFFRELIKAVEQASSFHEAAAKPIFKTILKLTTGLPG